MEIDKMMNQLDQSALSALEQKRFKCCLSEHPQMSASILNALGKGQSLKVLLISSTNPSRGDYLLRINP